VGADVRNDIVALNRLRQFTPKGFIDLQNEVSRYNIEAKSLRKISGIVLGKKVSKAQRLSNWAAKQLTPQQQMYAATDAWVCIEIYNKLTK
jgi:ribonuclease D